MKTDNFFICFGYIFSLYKTFCYIILPEIIAVARGYPTWVLLPSHFYTIIRRRDGNNRRHAWLTEILIAGEEKINFLYDFLNHKPRF